MRLIHLLPCILGTWPHGWSIYSIPTPTLQAGRAVWTWNARSLLEVQPGFLSADLLGLWNFRNPLLIRQK